MFIAKSTESLYSLSSYQIKIYANNFGSSVRIMLKLQSKFLTVLENQAF
jgi:hypothetical protein